MLDKYLYEIYYNHENNSERGEVMSTEDETIAKTLAEAISALPDGKREYLIGYAEGVAAMAEAAKERTNGETEPRQ